MPGDMRRRSRLVGLITGLGLVWLLWCAVAAAQAPTLPTPAGLCEHTCMPASAGLAGPVILPPSGVLLPLPQPFVQNAHEATRRVLSLTVRGTVLSRAPPHPAPASSRS